MSFLKMAYNNFFFFLNRKLNKYIKAEASSSTKLFKNN